MLRTAWMCLAAVAGGAAISDASQGLGGLASMKFSRDFESQADLLGTHIMALAGYDPHDLARVFPTIERENGAGGPQWLSDHPNPGNRFEYINAGADRLQIANVPHDGQGPKLVTFVPAGGSGDVNGHVVFTHGVEIGALPSQAPDLQTAAEDLLQSLAQSNPRLGRGAGYDPSTIAGRAALQTVVSNMSEVTGRDERIDVTVTRLGDGTLFYVLGVAPRDAFPDYVPFFRRVIESIELLK